MDIDTCLTCAGGDVPERAWVLYGNDLATVSYGATSGFGEDMPPLQLGVSFFDDEDCLGPARVPDWSMAERRTFDALVASRMQYLDRLPSLKEDWISGGGTPPSPDALQLSRQLLASVRHRVQSGGIHQIPRLVMGPVPSGGLAIELHADENNAINVTILNNREVELEVLHEGFYHEVRASRLELVARAIGRYASIAR